MNETEMRDKMRAFITRELIRDEEYELADDEGIISEGLNGLLRPGRIRRLCRAGVRVYIPDADLTVAKMDTLDQMVARVLATPRSARGVRFALHR